MAHGASCCTAGRRSAFGSGSDESPFDGLGDPARLRSLLAGVSDAAWRDVEVRDAADGGVRGFRDLAAIVEERAGDGLGLILLDLVTDLTRLGSEAAA
jgi:hypothetical protein